MTAFHVAVLDGGALQCGGVELIDSWKRAGGAKLWVDIENPQQHDIEPLLETRFGFHELAAEDAVSQKTLPKYDRFSDYDFFIFRSADVNLREHGSRTYKLAAFLGRNFLFTVHREPLAGIAHVRDRLPSDTRILGNGTDFLLYAILDDLVDAHFPLLENIEECVDDLQEQIFADAKPAHLDELLHLKRDVNILRRISMPQRELLNQISRGDAQFVQRQHLIYFRDIYDHMFRISETIDVERDLMAGTMDAYLSVVANRTNDIMKVLTILSVILLPITAIAGIYGMNFEHMPELHWFHGYLFALALMASTTTVLLVWFYTKGWLRMTQMPRQRTDRSS